MGLRHLRFAALELLLAGWLERLLLERLVRLARRNLQPVLQMGGALVVWTTTARRKCSPQLLQHHCCQIMLVAMA